jgi:amino acid transporter
MGDALSQVISGALVMGYFVAGLYFLRFWRDTRDRLFGIFAAAFWLLAAQRAALALTVDPTGEQVLLYSVRLLAFVLILAAIIDKNRGGD